MATLHFSGTDVKVFTPISSALSNLPNGAGTIVVLVKQTSSSNQDLCGLTDSAASAFYHSLSLGFFTATTKFFDDDQNASAVVSTAAYPTSTTTWYLTAVDWGSGGALERFHYRDQTLLSSWTHTPSTGNNAALRAGPGTGGWFRLGYNTDASAGAKDEALVAVWAGTRFADSDYDSGSWTKTSDLYNSPKGPPTFLCELNASTLVDLIGGSTYSSANSSGTTLTGADPDNWTFDGIGTPAVPVMAPAFNAIPFMGR